MTKVVVRIVDQTKRVLDATKKATVKNLTRSAEQIKETAKESIVISSEPSQEGSPPHTRKGDLREAIDVHVGTDDALIGPTFSKVGTIGSVHEFGKEYKGQDFDIREFMGPALEKTKDRLATEWYGTV